MLQKIKTPLTISIHAPRTGSDYRLATHPARREISIHAPRTGSDGLQRRKPDGGADFNPRSPHGERPCRHRPRLDGQQDFNPRSPHGERQLVCLQFNVSEISIHAPRTGSDRRRNGSVCRMQNFNPRSPHGERHISPRQAYYQGYFNPRSPHGERQDGCFPFANGDRDFNPRSPHGERQLPPRRGNRRKQKAETEARILAYSQD